MYLPENQLSSSTNFEDMNGVPKQKVGSCWLPDAPSRQFYMEPWYLYIPTSIPNMNFLARSITEI